MKKKQKCMYTVCGKVLFVFFMVHLAGCGNKVLMSADDQTVPDIRWDILDQDTGDHGVVMENNQEVALQEGKIYPTFCKADDPEGVKKVVVKITANLFCQKNVDNPSSADYYRHKQKMYTIVEKKNYEPDEKNMVPASGFVTTDLNGTAWKGIDCGNGYTSSSVRNYTMECTAWNWSNQRTTRLLKVKHAEVFQ